MGAILLVAWADGEVRRAKQLLHGQLTLSFSMMLQHVTEDLDDKDGIYIRFRTDGSLFNLRHL